MSDQPNYKWIGMILVAIVGIFSAMLFLDHGKEPELTGITPANELSWNTKEQQDLALRAFQTVDTYFNPNVSSGTIERNDIEPRPYDHVFVSLLVDGSLRCCQKGSGDPDGKNRVMDDIRTGTLKCIKDNRFGGELLKTEAQNVSVIFDYLYNKKQIYEHDLSGLSKEIEMGIHAIQVENNGKTAYFKASVPITKNYTLQKTFNRLCEKAGLEADCYKEEQTAIFRYDAKTYQSGRALNVQELYRYNVLIKKDEITDALVKNRIELGGQWFLNNTNAKTGLLEYLYFPNTDKYSAENNHVRQVASLWAMSKLKEFTGKTDWDGLITKTLDHYLMMRREEISAKTPGQSYGYILVDNDSKLAYNAFLIMALQLMKDYPKRDELMRSFANGILEQQQDDGSFHTFFHSEKNTGQDFYPGECILALMKLYQKTKEPRYMETVQKAFTHYRDYWRNNKNTAFIPWHSQAYLLLYQETKNQEPADFVFEMNDWLIDNYQDIPRDYPDLEGGFKILPGNSTNAYMEGVNDAYALAVLVGDEAHQQKYRDAIIKGTRFMLQSQFTKDNTFYMANPKRAIGGFRENLSKIAIRNDYIQHAVCALMKGYQNNIFN